MVSIESAYLQLYPVKKSYGDTQPLPKSLQLYSADTNGSTEDVIYNSAGTSVQTGSLVIDNNLYLNTYYTFDPTSFMQSNFGTIGTKRKKLKSTKTLADISKDRKKINHDLPAYATEAQISTAHDAYNPDIPDSEAFAFQKTQRGIKT